MKTGICVLALIATIAGCTTSVKNADSVREIEHILAQWKEAILAGDLEPVLAFYSDDLRNADRDKPSLAGEDKPGFVEEMKAMLIRIKKQDGLIDIQDATITVDGTHASVSPVTIATRTGAITRRLTFEKAIGQWRIVGVSKT